MFCDVVDFYDCIWVDDYCVMDFVVYVKMWLLGWFYDGGVCGYVGCDCLCYWYLFVEFCCVFVWIVFDWYLYVSLRVLLFCCDGYCIGCV